MNSKRSVLLLPITATLLLVTLASAGRSAISTGQEPQHTTAVPLTSVDELILMIAKKKPVTIIDVRHLDSYDEKIVGALQIPEDEVESRLKEVPRNRPVVTYCA